LWLPDYTVGATDEFWMDKDEKWFDMPALGRKLAKNIHGTPLKEAMTDGKDTLMDGEPF
jgi:hypothetical protein